eukprot:6734568-Pyramimonas_sp.AAC.1
MKLGLVAKVAAVVYALTILTLLWLLLPEAFTPLLLIFSSQGRSPGRCATLWEAPRHLLNAHVVATIGLTDVHTELSQRVLGGVLSWWLRCERVRALPTCVEGAFRGSKSPTDITVTRANIAGFVPGLGTPHGGTLEVAQFLNSSNPSILANYLDRLKWKQSGKPPIHLRIPVKVVRPDSSHLHRIAQMQKALPRKHAFGDGGPKNPFSSCALVASSNVLLQHEFGAQIDNHSV